MRWLRGKLIRCLVILHVVSSRLTCRRCPMASTTSTTSRAASFACHCLARISNGQTETRLRARRSLMNTFAIKSDCCTFYNMTKRYLNDFAAKLFSGDGVVTSSRSPNTCHHNCMFAKPAAWSVATFIRSATASMHREMLGRVAHGFHCDG